MKTRLVIATLTALVLGGCASGEPAAVSDLADETSTIPDVAEETSTIPDVAEEPAEMPDVVGEQLDVALSEIESAGFTEDVELLGGGTFGVLVEANWRVCAQLPEPGEDLIEPRLTVERSCEGEEEAAESTTTSPTTTAPTTTVPAVLETLSAANSPEFAAILTEGDNCAASIGSFAEGNSGRTIDFDGHITAVSPHGSAQTRFDILVSPGDQNGAPAGPSFQYRDVSPFDMKLTGQVPPSLQAGQAFRFTAEVGGYEPSSCLFVIRPVNTQSR